jgi:hypothetical protein
MIIGSNNASLTVFLNHEPPETTYSACHHVQPLTQEWMMQIIDAGGNNWRKVFNLYSKLCFQLTPDSTLASWQDYRDQRLLHESEPYQLICYSGALSSVSECHTQILNNDCILSLVTGKKCAASLGLLDDLHWLDQDFAQVIGKNILVTPYFDYRQLSNAKMDTLVSLVRTRL